MPNERPEAYHTVTRLALGVALVSLASCYSNGQTTCGQENSRSAPLRGTVTLQVEGGSTAPGAGSLVFVELCHLYSDNPDPSKANPNYRYSALADDAGDFVVNVPAGTVGLHSVLEGYTYGFTAVNDSTTPGIKVVNAEPLGARPPPTASNFVVSSATAKPGDLLRFSIDIQAAPTDPISEEVLLAEPSSGLARAFDPPSRGQQGRGYPNGTWTATFSAPGPGTHTYFAQATSEQCAVSKRLSVVVTVQ